MPPALPPSASRLDDPLEKADPLEELAGRLGAERLVRDPAELSTYASDALSMVRGSALAVALCDDRSQVETAVRWCARHGVPFVARGAGTGLSGGATPVRESLVIDVGRMRSIREIDAENRLAVVEPGVTTLRVSQAAARFGLHFAPDPSSEKACTVGGNVAENSGGPHCLKYGTTVDHVLALELVLPSGEVVRLGDPAGSAGGIDLVPLVIGSEGTFGIVTEVTVRLTPDPPAVRTYLAIFDSMRLACRLVTEVTRQGIVPAALEIMDQRTIRAVEASTLAAGYPEEAAAVVLIELDGFEASMEEDERRIRRVAAECRALRFEAGHDVASRARLWKGRKAAFGAMGRINTDIYVLDGVVPRTRLEETLEAIYEIADRHGVTVTNVFHAGDGNVHPSIAFDGRDPEARQGAVDAGREMLQACVDAGGSVTGEHGVGIEKMEFLPMMLDPESLQLQRELRRVFDPRELANPGKIFLDPRDPSDGPGGDR